MVYSENLQKLVRDGRGVRGMVFSESKAGLNLRDSLSSGFREVLEDTWKAVEVRTQVGSAMGSAAVPRTWGT